MIAATNRLRDYPVRIVYQREPLRAKSRVAPLLWLTVGVVVATFWAFAVIGMVTVAGWVV